MGAATVDAYHAGLAEEDAAICDILRAEINRGLQEADNRMWHAHPVWFLKKNPIVGYSKLKDCVRLMFWSGQSFAVPGLAKSGSFKAAEKRYRSMAEIDQDALARWLAEARDVQWDYANIVKRKGKLVRLV